MVSVKSSMGKRGPSQVRSSPNGEKLCIHEHLRDEVGNDINQMVRRKLQDSTFFSQTGNGIKICGKRGGNSYRSPKLTLFFPANDAVRIMRSK